jgi:hypothetical protein
MKNLLHLGYSTDDDAAPAQREHMAKKRSSEWGEFILAQELRGQKHKHGQGKAHSERQRIPASR